ncbi:MAG: aminotransferase class V-fold PLP-dependent enzyme [Gammaproteobacteria bacterium]|nr:aminotransferase class V-fold PLP-dependent enzyme [Gammaproteobacteria bacterium]MCW8840541.1 aminotransferase class V-fold PLP-dependent enzyme [Gammaproteobacteria bacterium]MCW8927922.1 aminotransferase class V-fold PLP-dependent enzyme [Gammaproteobacteria bacterium]MCW8958043.1 aminotransferase class V-fold PLP-dependent enzyme [Gammaproteobacteria bacterium]MCW8991805.1 aminotransferase class V-fold PLP-dependent enzyme [Gammaproteobacteria bacterium]
MSYTREFPLLEGLIYLNHAAVSPWPQRTADAVQRFASQNVRQGSLSYPQWLEAEQQLREQIRDLINAPHASDIALVKNTSEALSIVAYGLAWNAGDNIVSSDQEFPSNRIVWESLAPRGVELRQASLAHGDTPEDALFALVDENTRLITVSSVQYATGMRMDLARIGRFCRQHDILFCVDAIQEIGALPFDVQHCEADFVAADGHKWMMGPEGLGLFYCRESLRERLQLNQFGWHMVEAVGDFDQSEWQAASTARRFECGSPNMLGIHALSASLSLLLEVGMRRVAENVRMNSRYLITQLGTMGFRVITPDETERHAGIVSFNHPEGTEKTAELHSKLTENHVFCALRGGNIRFSPHFYTPKTQLEQCLVLLR